MCFTVCLFTFVLDYMKENDMPRPYCVCPPWCFLLAPTGLRNRTSINLSMALRSIWPCLARMVSGRPWAEFNIQVSSDSMAIYKVATKCTIAEGFTTLFWTHRWLWEGRIQDIMPSLSGVVKKNVIKVRMVNHVIWGEWWRDVSPNMSTQEIHEFLKLVNRIWNVELVDFV